MITNQYISAIFPTLFPHLLVVIGVVVAALWNLVFPHRKHFTPIFGLLTLLGAAAVYIAQFDARAVDLFGKLQQYLADPAENWAWSFVGQSRNAGFGKDSTFLIGDGGGNIGAAEVRAAIDKSVRHNKFQPTQEAQPHGG
jgi:hypothetical protein